jgi:urease accessory protein
MAADAAALHRETLVLGRDGEQPGAATSRTRVTRAECPILDETVCTGDLEVLRSAAVTGGGARVIASIGRFGVDAPAPAGAFALGPSDVLVREIAPHARALRTHDELWRQWTDAMRSAA